MIVCDNSGYNINDQFPEVGKLVNIGSKTKREYVPTLKQSKKQIKKAEYGKKILETLSIALNNEFGKGFSFATLENYRKFYITYKNRIPEPAVRELEDVNSFFDQSYYLIQ